MKKLTNLFICSCMVFSLSGCTIGDVLTGYVNDSQSVSSKNQETETISEAPKHRVYMDEVKGTLQDFTGENLTLSTETQTYVFDLSQATLECEDGMITGDEISVIYEGQLDSSDTSTVKALKVVDDYHKKNELEIRRAYGEVQSLTPNTITIKNKKGKTATYPITGAEQYYQNGIHTGTWVYIHFKGKFAASDNEQQGSVLNASHLKVLSISDIDPLVLPEPTPTPDPTQETDEASASKQLHAEIQNISTNILTVLPSGYDTSVNVDLSQISSYFKGGTAPGSYVNITYTGELQTNTLDGISIIAVSGDDPDSFNGRNLNYTVTGTIIGHTSNTVTIQTQDGATITCFAENVKNSSTSGMETGASIRITFDPSKSKDSNIYTSVKIEDA